MSKNPNKIIIAETQAVVGYSCPTCRLLYTLTLLGGGPGAEEQVIRMATECCDHRCPDCDAPRDMGWTHCPQCRVRRAKERDVERFAAAPKETIAAYRERNPDGMVTDGNDGFWSVDSYVDDEVWLRHPRVWFCMPKRGIKLDASDVVQSWVDDSFEGAEDHLDLTALQALLDDWCAKQDVCAWHMGNTALDPAEIARLGAEGAARDAAEATETDVA